MTVKKKSERKWIQKQPSDREKALKEVIENIRKMAEIGLIEILEEKPGGAFKIRLTEAGAMIGPRFLREKGRHEMADLLEQKLAEES